MCEKVQVCINMKGENSVSNCEFCAENRCLIKNLKLCPLYAEMINFI